MANRRERALLGRIHQVLNECGALRPSNPANTAAIFAHSPVLTECCRDVARAVAALGYGDEEGYEFADDYIADAEKRLARHRERGDIGMSSSPAQTTPTPTPPGEAS